MSSSAKAAAKRNRILAVGVAIAGHLAIGMFFVLERPRMAPTSETAIDVQLLPMTRPKRPVYPARRAIQQRLASAPAPRGVDARQSPPQTAQTKAGPAVGEPAPPPEVDARLTSALRGTVGCNATSLVHLSAAEREACERRARSLGAGFATANLGVDPSKRLAFDAAAKRDLLSQPFLALKPKNGCVPRVASTSDLPGKAPQETTAGVACALSF